MQTREEWMKTRRVGFIWWCGDDDCDCVQAQIDDITPNHATGMPWIRRAEIWRGRFWSEAWSSPWKEEGHLSPEEELQEAIKKFGGTI